MKKRLLAFVSILTMTCSLTACQFLMPFIDGGEDAYSYHSGTPSHSSKPSGEESSIPDDSIDSSRPAPETGVANKASYNYMDFVKNNVSYISSTPSVGTANILIIPVWFTNSSTYVQSSKRETVRSDIETAYFGSKTDTGWNSVKSFYEEESHGSLTLTGKVSSWYECGQSISRYTTDDDQVTKTRSLVNSATTWYFNNNPTDAKTNYDKDGDGYLDGVIIIYAAPDCQALNNDSYENLWAYCFWMSDPSVKSTSNPGTNAFFWASYDYIYGTNAVSKTGSSYHSGDTRYCKVDAHTYIHEMGHMFGLEDYYDYSKNEYKPAGMFSMQDHNVGGHDPFSSYALGWGKAYVPTESVTIELKPFTDSGEMILLSPNYNSYNSPFDEYLLLEYYTPTGLNELDTTYAYCNSYPKGSPERGIRLWHVDARLLYTTTGYFDATKMTTNPATKQGKVALAISNTYDDGTHKYDGYLSPLGASYYNYNLLQLIRNNTSATYKPKDKFTTDSLFREGSEFTMNRYSSQFVRSGKLNTGDELGFSFRVNKIYTDRISVSVYKA